MTSMDPDMNIGWYDDETGQWDKEQPSPPSLPYAGTSGHSGSEASRERAERMDTSGETGELQLEVLAYVFHHGPTGRTIKEVRDKFTGYHHGSLSGTLTNLHKTGRLLRLVEQRGKCSVYVHPRFLLGREAVPPKTYKNIKVVVVTEDMNAEYIGHLVVAALNENDKIVVRREE